MSPQRKSSMPWKFARGSRVSSSVSQQRTPNPRCSGIVKAIPNKPTVRAQRSEPKRPFEASCCAKYQVSKCDQEACKQRHVCAFCFLVGTHDAHRAPNCRFFPHKIRDQSPARMSSSSAPRRWSSCDNPDTAPGSAYHAQCMRERREWYAKESPSRRTEIWQKIVQENVRWKSATGTNNEPLNESKP